MSDLQAAGPRVGHLPFKGGRQEVDFVVEGGGRILGVAVKLARSVADRDVRHLHWLAANSGQPTSLMVLTTGEEAFTRADGVAVVPLALLGP